MSDFGAELHHQLLHALGLLVGQLAAGHRDGAERHRVQHQLHVFRREDVRRNLDLAGVAKDRGDLLDAPIGGGMKAAEREPGSVGRGVALDLARHEAIGRQLGHAAERAGRADHIGDDVRRHRVLQSDQETRPA